jgi:hypothetical protein
LLDERWVSLPLNPTYGLWKTVARGAPPYQAISRAAEIVAYLLANFIAILIACNSRGSHTFQIQYAASRRARALAALAPLVLRRRRNRRRKSSSWSRHSLYSTDTEITYSTHLCGFRSAPWYFHGIGYPIS